MNIDQNAEENVKNMGIWNLGQHGMLYLKLLRKLSGASLSNFLNLIINKKKKNSKSTPKDSFIAWLTIKNRLSTRD